MEGPAPKLVLQQPIEKEATDANGYETNDVTTNREDYIFPEVKDEKNSDSDAHSEDLSCNGEQNNAISSSSSQFYESSDSKLDYAVKIEDNDTLSDIDDLKTDSASADSEDSALGSLPPDFALTDREEEVQDRSEGSDSGLGSEAIDDIKLPNFNLALPCKSNNKSVEPEINEKHTEGANENDIKNEQHDSYIPQVKTPLRSSLKRKCRDETLEDIEPKRRKEGIRFDNVTVYYFPRAQGFSCVPSQGGSTLGMEWEHSHAQKFTLVEHALEQRRLHRLILQQLKSERHSLKGVSLSSSEDSDTEEETSDISESELDLDSYYFLQPVPTRQRRALLRAAGVRKIEGYEKDECRDIRTSREFCGCACKGTCNPESCSCSLAGIKCQVDRLNFPCGCTRDGCCNTTGRIEFNPVRVRTHFIQTLMRIGLEKKNEENQEAAKRQWAEAHSTNAVSCLNNSSYNGDRCLTHEDGLLRDVSLSPRVEVESCVNSGSFNNIHCNMNNLTAQNVIQSDPTYAYSNCNSATRSVNQNNMMPFENSNNHHTHADPYSSNILQGKGPPYSTANTIGFDTTSNNIQRFPCDLNYAYEQNHSDTHNFKGLQSFSATSFEEFAHNSQMTMFSHYGQMYVPDYLHKPSTSMHDHNSTQYNTMPQNNYNIYKNNSECVSSDAKGVAHYGTLMTLPYQTSNKLQEVENDENWFSHNTLINLDHSDQTTQDAADLQPQSTEAPTENNTTETTENFGELIKKTMVESVTV